LPLLPGGGFVSGEVRRPQRRKAPRDAWTDAEDAKLRSVVDNHRTPKQVMPGEKGPTSRIRWSQLAKMMPNRTGKQCRERWADHVDPQLKRVAWSAEEDETLFTQQELIGNKWAQIAVLLPGRSRNQVKNRFHSFAHGRWKARAAVRAGRPASAPRPTMMGAMMPPGRMAGGAAAWGGHHIGGRHLGVSQDITKMSDSELSARVAKVHRRSSLSVPFSLSLLSLSSLNLIFRLLAPLLPSRSSRLDTTTTRLSQRAHTMRLSLPTSSTSRSTFPTNPQRKGTSSPRRNHRASEV
jgi:hypothetical protein